MNFEKLFYPENIAIIGASPNLSGGKLPYFQVLRDNNFKGKLYPVNPAHEFIDGTKVYSDISEIDKLIDLAIITAPLNQAEYALKSCVKNKIPFVHFFTSGFAEMRNYVLEASLMKIIENTETRIVGPNCLGVLCAESNLTFSFKLRQEKPGSVGFIGQSGGVTDNFISLCGSKLIGLNKVVSYGNQIDLKVEDYLAYFAEDKGVKVIAAYVEDIKNGREFIRVVKNLASSKPTIILKGGSTLPGASAAASHTGALAVPHQLFSSLLRQTGCIEADSFEELLDITMLATTTKLPKGIEAGFVGGGGGNSVTSVDLAAKSGIKFPPLKPSTQQKIQSTITKVNTSTKNPVDLGALGFDMEVVMQALKSLDQDESINIIIADFTIGMLPHMPELKFQKVAEVLADLEKPVFPIVWKVTEHVPEHEIARLEFLRAFRSAGLPVFQNIKNASVAIQKFVSWRNRFQY
jgi:acetate---CoA ligase (ADP-forming) subunit alpha